MSDVITWFPEAYEESRDMFRRDADLVRRVWPDAKLDNHRIAADEDLTIDWIEAPGVERNSKLLLFTTGEHGIEGYVGAAMLHLFMQEFLPLFDRRDTGLLLVHAINPWGMKHKRRTNRNNVDLNRNFIWSASEAEAPGATLYDPAVNPDYDRLNPFLNPQRSVRKASLSKLGFTMRLLWTMITAGPAALRAASLLGQYRFAKGIYYGGDACQEEVRVLMGLYRAHVQQYRRILHLDIHTGFGPRYQMSVVNSPLEPRHTGELEEAFDYPRVLKANPEEFYSIHGDMIDYMYNMVKEHFPDRDLYATSFEFGTLGTSFSATVQSLRTMILENQAHWHGVANTDVRDQVAMAFRDMFIPSEPEWRAEAVSDARQAFAGILRAEGFISARSPAVDHAADATSIAE
ncbi:MAG: DUF2817 domain-containing protein [Chloroflexi bacterium]|nr:DUF2817 domain-containing protein [Chloroflexota bacterium]